MEDLKNGNPLTCLSSIDAKPTENMAVVCWRHEGKLPVSTKEVEKLGGIFHDAGSTFDLDNPPRFGVILTHQRVWL